jgi:chemotaxis protein MotB
MAEAEEEKKDEQAAAPAEGEAAAAPPADPAAAEDTRVAPKIYKKVLDDGHAGAHGGAWKIALADMMTAMMAFFLLMWLLGATPEEQRQGIAEYFQPSDQKTSSAGELAGSNGMFGGRSIIDPESIPDDPQQSAMMERVTPRTEAGPDENQGSSPNDKTQESKNQKNLTEEQKREIAAQAEKEKVDMLEKEVQERMTQNAQLSELKSQVNFIRQKDGLRIEIIDKANFSMFGSGGAGMNARAQALIREVGKSVATMPNKLSVKGHTDSIPFTDGSNRSNWSLSLERAEATRKILEQSGIPASRFARIEGLADKVPYNAGDPLDPRNRRMSITVLYNDPPPASPAAPSTP